MSDQVSSKTTSSPVNHDFGPNNGGDLVLCSVDNVDFNVHTVILNFASPVLADMLSVGSEKTKVNVGETSEILDIMLGFIYPRPTPTISSFETLDQAFHVAEKYQLAGMKSSLRKELSLKGSPVSAFSNPLRAYAIAAAHGLIEETVFASSLISKSYDLRKVDDLLKLSEAAPSSAHIVKLVGAPLARINILINVFFHYHTVPIRLYEYPHASHLLCDSCKSTNYRQQRFSSPEWQARWAFWAFQELMKRPLSQCEHVFKIEFFKLSMCKGPIPLPTGACVCHTKIYGSPNYFEDWAGRVRSHLGSQLAVLDQLGRIA